MQIDRTITIALIILAIILLVIFVVMPEYTTFGALQTQLAEKKAQFNAEHDYYAAIAKTYDDLQVHKDDIKKIDDALPTDPDLGRIVYYLQQNATSNGMIIKNLFLSKSSPAKAGAVNSVGDMVFSVDLLGQYPSLEQFIISLEKSSRIFEVTNISFGSSSQQAVGSTQTQFQMQETYDFNLQIKTHSY